MIENMIIGKKKELLKRKEVFELSKQRENKI